MLTKPQFDDLETRSADQRAADLAKALPQQIARAQGLPGYGDTLKGVDASQITSAAALADLPVLRKSELGKAQAAQAPFGGFQAGDGVQPCLPVARPDLRALQQRS